MKHRSRWKGHSCSIAGCGKDQVWTFVNSALNDKGGYNWQEDLCQADIMTVIVTATREYDRRA
jgi:hypothetical protein